DILCFLDPDDRYERHYFRKIVEVYREKSYVDFIYVGYKDVGERNQVVLNFDKDREIGVTSIMTAVTGKHFWSLTSTISMRKPLAKKLLTLPPHYDWDFTARADTAIEIAATVIGAYRYFIAEPLMLRMVHDTNFTHTMGAVPVIEHRYWEGFRRVRYFFIKEYSISTDDAWMLKREFKRLSVKDTKVLNQYIFAIKKMKTSYLKKMRAKISIYKYYYRRKK
ncbi:MAG: glycosyltransferase family 2 protein, partial [Desulfobulbaceae bacterium]|nr:glycosyltransferase family 2 protein [Desulfobulbaceae bacterium]